MIGPGQTFPIVSVISIFHNAEQFFVEAIESVLAQEFSDFEFLLVDDGSSDGSTAIARDYERRFPGKIRYLEHEGHVNLGMSATRNLGLAVATGQFVAFIDADDRWTSAKLREQVDLLKMFPALGAVCGSVNYWRSWSGGEDWIVPTGATQDCPVPPPLAALSLYPLGKAAAPCPSDLMLRRSVIDAVGGFEAHFTGPRQMYEDQGFLAKLYLHSPIYFSSQTWLDYRQHDDSCVSEVVRDGHYDKVRLYFLNWYSNYLRQTIYRNNWRLRLALKRAFLPYQQGWWNRLLLRLVRV